VEARYDIRLVGDEDLPEGVNYAAVNDHGQCVVFVKRQRIDCEKVVAALAAHRPPRSLQLE
jgi:hypothetical protein